MNKLTIKAKFPSLNEYTQGNRTNKYLGNKTKQDWTNLVYAECLLQNIKPVEKAFIKLKWYEKNRKRDKDNISFSKKFILDGLVKAGVLKGDGWEHVAGFYDSFELADEYKVEVDIVDVVSGYMKGENEWF